MPELQLVHIALVGARMSAFKEYGFHDRNQLAMRRVAPLTGGRSLPDIPAHELAATLRAELPIWIHNMIADPEFPGREQLLMPLRRFEGELHDSKSNDVVAAVLNAGFRSQTLDPLNLPGAMPLRERCAMEINAGVWQEAYRRLEEDLITIVSTRLEEVSQWINLSRDTRHTAIEPGLQA